MFSVATGQIYSPEVKLYLSKTCNAMDVQWEAIGGEGFNT